MYLCRTLGELLRMHSGCFCFRSNNVWFWKEQVLVSKLMKQRTPTACRSQKKGQPATMISVPLIENLSLEDRTRWTPCPEIGWNCNPKPGTCIQELVGIFMAILWQRTEARLAHPQGLPRNNWSSTGPSSLQPLDSATTSCQVLGNAWLARPEFTPPAVGMSNTNGMKRMQFQETCPSRSFHIPMDGA